MVSQQNNRNEPELLYTYIQVRQHIKTALETDKT